MKIGVLPIKSVLADEGSISFFSKDFLKELEKKLDTKLDIITFDKKDDYDLILTFVLTGGSEGFFKKMYKDLKEPYLLLTHGAENSLAASLEILTFLKRNNLKGEILHGSFDYIADRIKSYKESYADFHEKLGVLGHPSDWLISTEVDYQKLQKLYGLELVDISLDEVVEEYEELSKPKNVLKIKSDNIEEKKAKMLYKAIEAVKNKYQLSGLTIRCFDLLKPTKTTGCLALSMLNDENITAACEGDIPAFVSMHVANHLFGTCGFMANPSRIDMDKKTMIFAHCTIPCKMCKSYHYDTHFESGTGIAIKGELEEKEITVFRIGYDLESYVAIEGKIIRNLSLPNLCRTQIEVSLEDYSYFLNNPLGNHHIIIYGHHKKDIDAFFKKENN